jgi:hypothetical protein
VVWVAERAVTSELAGIRGGKPAIDVSKAHETFPGNAMGRHLRGFQRCAMQLAQGEGVWLITGCACGSPRGSDQGL